MDDPNRCHHIFGERRHNLAPLVRDYRDEEAAAQAIEDAVGGAFEAGQLIVDDDGMYKQMFDISGHSVMVSGRVIDGVVHVGTA